MVFSEDREIPDSGSRSEGGNLPRQQHRYVTVIKQSTVNMARMNSPIMSAS